MGLRPTAVSALIVIAIFVVGIVGTLSLLQLKVDEEVARPAKKTVHRVTVEERHALGKEIGRVQEGGPAYHVFFQPKYESRDSLMKVVRYYKSRNSAHTFRVVFFDDWAITERPGYPLSARAQSHLIGEYIFNRRQGIDTLYDVEH